MFDNLQYNTCRSVNHNGIYWCWICHLHKRYICIVYQFLNLRWRRLFKASSWQTMIALSRIACYCVHPLKCFNKHKERHTAHTIVPWPNPKQWVIVHTSDSMMMIRQSIYILSIITREMGQLKTHTPTCFVMDNWENMPYLTHTLDKLYLAGILWVQCLQISLHNDNELV